MSESHDQFDPLVDERPSRFIVGIDLGTTNSAVTYIDSAEQPWSVRELAIPQLVAAGQVESRNTLPSFLYQPAEGELAASQLRLPWQEHDPQHAVGSFARDQGAKAPSRLIASAKSWLCHPAVDRSAPLLPWHGAPDLVQLSPVEVSGRYLAHIREAWDSQFPAEPLSRQDIVLTLPASFDEVARELTIQAAGKADLPRVVLIEEPQAAFYAWVYKHAHVWNELVKPGQTILVCDIGGGTSDFTLIQVRESEGSDQNIQFHRIAVGDHLILGGDNLDLALARDAENRLTGGTQLHAHQWDVLVSNCRHAKEVMLGDDAPERITINLPGSGAQLIGGSQRIELSRDEIRQLLIEGFLPFCERSAVPSRAQSGFQELGLPYAGDAGITKHLAFFLASHCLDAAGGPRHASVCPDVILFNGGFFASSLLKQRLLDVVSSWFRCNESEYGSDWTPVVLENDRLDMAVARGAAYYGMVRRGEGVRITANLARSYYICVEADEPTAVCLVPGHAEPGHSFDLAQSFELLVSQPVEFPLLVSSTRLTDRAGQLIPVDLEQMKHLPPIRTVLRGKRKEANASVSVNLHARLTEIGTIDLWCSQVDSDRSWKLQFDVRSATQTDVAAHEGAAEAEGIVDEDTWRRCAQHIEDVFSAQGIEKPRELVGRLSESLGSSRHDWPTSILRRIWETLMESEAGRRRSQAHESRWLNLVGYSLRPGYGLALDDWRVAETWRKVQGTLIHSSVSGRNESLILWRRLSGGLSKGQQQTIAERLVGPVRVLHRQLTTGSSRRNDVALSPQESSEVWRLLGSLERINVALKIELGDMLVDLLPKRKMASAKGAMIWALSRLGQRVPIYGPLNVLVAPEKATDWLDFVMEQDGNEPLNQLAAMLLSRRTHDRYRDVEQGARDQAIRWLTNHDAPEHLIELIEAGGTLDSEEQHHVFGEALPKGLRICG